MDLKDLFNNAHIGDEVIVQGWIRNHRKHTIMVRVEKYTKK